MKIVFRNKCMIQWCEEKIIVILREETVTWFKSAHFFKKDRPIHQDDISCMQNGLNFKMEQKPFRHNCAKCLFLYRFFPLLLYTPFYTYTWKLEGIKCRPSSCKYLLYSFLKAKGSNFPQIPFAVSYISVSDGINYECHNT